MNDPVAVLPALSVAVQVTVVAGPTENVLPDGGVQVTATVPSPRRWARSPQL